MSFWSAIFLGLVQGLAEFLPISSSGHLAFFQNFFNLSEADLLFDVLLHLGTLAAVIAAYRSDIAELLRAIFGRSGGSRPARAGKDRRQALRLALMLVVATLPLALVLPVKKQVEALYQNTIFIGFALLVTGFILFLSDRSARGKKTEREMTLADAVFVGLGQAIAVVPGLSRSGTTIAAGLTRGFDRSFAVKFSFLLSIPAVLGANLLSLIEAVGEGVDWSLLPRYLVGVVVAAVSGYVAIRLLRMLARRSNFGGFAWYCWGAGLVTLILSMFS